MTKLSPAARWLILLVVSFLIGGFFELAGLPAGFLLGPMFTAIFLAVIGGAVDIPRVPFQLAQVVIGCLIAQTITLPTLRQIGTDWPAFAAGVFSVLAVTLFIGWLLTRWRIFPGSTAIWGTSPGGALVMILMSSDYGGDERLVAVMQYVRVVVVASASSLLAAFITPGGEGAHSGAWLPHDLTSFGLTLGVIVISWVASRLVRISAGPLLIPIVLAALAHNALDVEIVLPFPLLMISFAIIGWGIGIRFTRETLSYAVKTMPTIITSVLVMMLACGGIAALLVVFTGVSPLTAYLATSPGGADSIAIIASSADVDVPYIMAMQLARLFAVMFIGPLCAQLVARWSGFGGKRCATKS